MKIAVATTTRADWGLLSPLATALRERGDEVLVLAANMHFNPLLGMTVREIEADGFLPIAVSRCCGDAAEIAADCLKAYYEVLQAEKPDCIICLGDRYEMLSIGQAAVMAGVPIVHIAGGAVSEGAMDDYFRNALTKLSWLHFTECEQYRLRVIHMGEDPARVIDTGAIGIHNILSVNPMAREDLSRELNFTLNCDTLICTMHAATQCRELTPMQQYEQLLAGLEEAMTAKPGLRVLFTYPNNDVDPAPLIRCLEEFRDLHPGRVCLIPSLGMRRYISALHYVGGVIGNSSGGIVEVVSMGIPVLDIGSRQHGRMRAASVLHAPCRAGEIARGIARLFTPEVMALAARRENPYAKPDTLSIMLAHINPETFRNSRSKTFFDSCATSI